MTFMLSECVENVLLYMWLIFSFALSGAYLISSIRTMYSPNALLLLISYTAFSASSLLIGILSGLGSPINYYIVSWFSFQKWVLKGFFISLYWSSLLIALYPVWLWVIALPLFNGIASCYTALSCYTSFNRNLTELFDSTRFLPDNGKTHTNSFFSFWHNANIWVCNKNFI